MRALTILLIVAIPFTLGALSPPDAEIERICQDGYLYVLIFDMRGNFIIMSPVIAVDRNGNTHHARCGIGDV